MLAFKDVHKTFQHRLCRTVTEDTPLKSASKSGLGLIDNAAKAGSSLANAAVSQAMDILVKPPGVKLSKDQVSLD